MANKDITETGVRSVLETMGIPSSFQGFKENAIGRVETAATIGSSIAGTMAGMGGNIFELMRSGDPRAALDQYRQIQEAMTYMPRTQGGLEKVQQIGEFFEPVGQLYEQYGEAVAESTGSPLAGEYFEEFVDPLFFLGGLGGIPRRAGRIADAATDAVYLYDLLDEGEKLITHSGGKIDDIKREGVFDGIFGVSGDFSGYGLNNGDVQTSFAVKADKIAGSGDIDFDYDKSMEFLRKEFPEATGGEIDELYSAIAEDDFSPWDNNVLERFGFNDPGEASFEAQRIRGKMASDQGFDAVAMSDESGTSYLLPFGSKAKKIAENGIPIADAAEDMPRFAENVASQTTQRSNTVGTAVKASNYLDEIGAEGKTLDYGAGLGENAKAIKADETFEPFPQGEFNPTYTDPAQVPANSYGRIVSTNVLNVLPPDIRAEAVQTIGKALEPGGTALIQTWDVGAAKHGMKSKKATIVPDEENAFTTSTGSYQKGFSKQELQEYIANTLGPGYLIEPVPNKARINGTAVTVKKIADPTIQVDLGIPEA